MKQPLGYIVTLENSRSIIEPCPDDGWVVTYPKCGTTWTQQIVRLIRNNGVQDDVRITTAVLWLEAGSPINMAVNAEEILSLSNQSIAA